MAQVAVDSVKPKLWTSRAWLHRKYIVEKRTEKEIAEIAGTNQSTINRWLLKFDMKKKRA